MTPDMASCLYMATHMICDSGVHGGGMGYGGEDDGTLVPSAKEREEELTDEEIMEMIEQEEQLQNSNGLW